MNRDLRAKFFLILGSVLLGVTRLLGCGVALLSVMLFDSPHSEENPATRLMFLSLLTYPLTCVVAIVAAWVLDATGQRIAAQITILLPMLNWLAFGAAWQWLSLVYHGKLGG